MRKADLKTKFLFDREKFICFLIKIMENKEEIAKKIVDEIINDLSDRSGLGNEWDCIDSDIKNEIIGTWRGIVEKQL